MKGVKMSNILFLDGESLGRVRHKKKTLKDKIHRYLNES